LKFTWKLENIDPSSIDVPAHLLPIMKAFNAGSQKKNSVSLIEDAAHTIYGKGGL